MSIADLNLKELAALPDDGPVTMVNLVRLRARSADGDGTGWDAYLRYSAETMPMIKARGGTVLWAGKSEAVALGVPDQDNWDFVVLVRYPSRAAFVDMMTSEDYENIANPHRINARSNMSLSQPLNPTASSRDLNVTSIKHGTLTVNGIKLHFAEQGSGNPVLFLHGFPEYWAAWRSVMNRIGDRFRAIAIDTRGINLSEGAAEMGGYAISELVEDVRQTVTALGYEKVTLVGHDWGGFIAWETAIRHPEIVERLIIINAAHTGVLDQLLRQGGAQAKASKYMLAFRSSRGEELVSRGDFAAFRREILEPELSSGRMNEEQAEEYLAVWRKPDSLTAGLNYYRANKSGPPDGDDGEPREIAQTVVMVPTLVIWGDKDMYFTPDNVDLMRDVVPDLTVRRYPDNDHWIVHQRPADIADLTMAFVDGKLAKDDRQ